MAKKYIAVAGNIGVGKSSLVDFLCKHYGLKPFFEPNDNNPYLADFYKDMKRWAYHSQLYFLAQKFGIHQRLSNHSETVVQDRTIYEDAEVFCTNLYNSGFLEARDYKTYMEFYHTILNAIQPPNIMIYLTCSVKTMRRRIALRGRAMESAIPIEYLTKLRKLYDRWIKSYKASPVLVIETEKMDYMCDFIDRHDLLKKIEVHL